MANITLKNIPEELHQMLKERAKTNHRSINSEILFSLKKVVGFNQPSEHEDVLSQARELRKKMRVTLSEADLKDTQRLGQE
jgi:antitoxin FitA